MTVSNDGSLLFLATTNGVRMINLPPPSSGPHLVVGGFPTPVTAGTAGSLTVTAEDTQGNPLIGYTGTVHFASSDPHAGLPADYTFTSADLGSHTFSVTLSSAGVQSITASDTASSAASGTQGNIIVNPAAASQLVVAGYPSATTAGAAHNFTVTAEDAYGNVITTYAGKVHFTSSDGQAVLPADYTFTTSDAGVHTFSATLKTTPSQSITATATANAALTGTQSGIQVSPAATSAFVVTGFPSPVTAGVAGTFTARAVDAYGNLTPGYTNAVGFFSSDVQAVLPGSYTFTTADAGVHTFAATLKTAGSQSITVYNKPNDSIRGNQTGIVVVPAAPPGHRC
jgi:hypothetical protein